MIEAFFTFLEQSLPLLPGQREALERILIEKEFPKKSMVIQEGQIADSFYFIVKGSFRSYFLRDGEDITDYFFFENSFASDYASLYGAKPSRFYLEPMEDTQVVQFKRSEFLELGKKDPLFESFGRVHAEMAFIEMEERARLLHQEKLENKFLWMMEKFPQVFQRVPQYHIASYLGVKAESLSRIKKGLGSSH